MRVMTENPYQAPQHYAEKQPTSGERRFDRLQSLLAFGGVLIGGPLAAFHAFSNGHPIWGSFFVAAALLMAYLAIKLWTIRNRLANR
jgi:hypothetical protein